MWAARGQDRGGKLGAAVCLTACRLPHAARLLTPAAPLMGSADQVIVRPRTPTPPTGSCRR